MTRVSSCAHSRRRVRSIIQTAVLSFLGASQFADAQVATWTFNGNGNWNTAANWSPVGVPDSSSTDVIIDNNNGSNVVVSLDVNAVVHTLTLDLGDQLSFNSSRRLAVGGATLNGNVVLGSRAEFGLSGAIANAGNILFTPGNASGDTYIDVLSAGATLSGGGSIAMVAGSSIAGLTPGGTLTIATQTIEGRGQLGRNSIAIINQLGGLVSANVAGQTLIVDPNAAGLINQGTMRATGSGVLQLAGNGGGSFNNTGGMIRAENASEVQLNGIDITGGTIESTGTGVVRTTAISDSFLTSTTHHGNMILGSRGDIGVTGTITNTGTILFTSGNATSDTLIDVQPAGATLTGGGIITMVAGSSITGTTQGGTLTIASQTIEGQDQIGRNSIAIAIQPGNIIRSNIAGEGMFIDPDTGGLTNLGTIEAVNGAFIQMTGNGGGSFNNTGGVIRAATGTEVQFTAGAEIVGGTLESTGTGLFRTTSSVNTIFQNLTNSGYVTTNSRGDITLRGTINNTGTIQINPGNATSDTILEIEVGGATLTGGGAIFMNGNTSTQFTGVLSAPLTITNQTIRGGGQVGAGQLVINNQANGIIHADTTGGILLVDVANTAGALSNTGLLQATSQGVLRINDAFTNDGIINAGASSLVDVNAVLTNGINGAIMGSGELEVSGQLINNGKIAPGNSPGTLTVDLGGTGNLAFSSSSVLEIELASVSAFDVLVINGRAALGGQLSVDLLGGYIPSNSDVFTILTATNLLSGSPPLGAFSNVANGSTLLTQDGGASFTVSYLGNSQVQLSNFTAVPEPGSLAVCGGLAVSGMFRRRR